MTTDTILACAKAGHRVYYRDRPWRRWDTSEAADQIRWEQLAAQVLNGTFLTPGACHDYYAADRAGYVEWADLSGKQKDKWRKVLDAIEFIAAEARRAA